MLRSVWDAYVHGEATPEDVLGVLDTVTGFINFELETLRQQALKGISDPESPTFQKIVGAFELHLEAIDRMAEEFPDESDSEDDLGEAFLEGFGLAQKATQQLIEAHAQTMEHIQAMATVGCIFCSHANARESQRCARCGRPLPGGPAGSSFTLVNQEGLEAGPPVGEVTQNYAMVAEAVENWRNGSIQTEELLTTLEDVEQRLACHRDESQQYYDEIKQAPPQAQAALSEAVAMTEEGLIQSLAAIEKMKLAFDKEDDSYLESGLHEFEKASNLMVQAYHASREAACKAR
ncbi:hypothetical protein IV102_11470 [bacterium]|nr:hypothetical protein [bacterium]